MTAPLELPELAVLVGDIRSNLVEAAEVAPVPVDGQDQVGVVVEHQH
jgi:hypothetical protein